MIGCWYLYAIRLPVNDYAVAYVGVTKNPRRRLNDHCRVFTAIGEAIQLCGWENIIFEILESGDRECIYQREVETIAAFNTHWPNGYNIASGGSTGRDPLPRTRAKISAAKKGKRLSAETCARMSLASKRKGKPLAPNEAARLLAANIGKTLSAETRAKISAANKGKKGRPMSTDNRAKIFAAHKDKPLSAEHRAKISASLRGKKPSAETRAKLSAVRLGKSHPCSAETRAKISKSLHGKKHSPETMTKMSVTQKARWALRRMEATL